MLQRGNRDVPALTKQLQLACRQLGQFRSSPLIQTCSRRHIPGKMEMAMKKQCASRSAFFNPIEIYFHALIAGRFPVVSMLVPPDRVPAAFARCVSGARATVRGSERDLERDRAASLPRALLTQRRCCSTVRSSPRATPIFPRARNCTTQLAEFERPPAAW